MKKKDLKLVKKLWQLWETLADVGEITIGRDFINNYNSLVGKINELKTINTTEHVNYNDKDVQINSGKIRKVIRDLREENEMVEIIAENMDWLKSHGQENLIDYMEGEGLEQFHINYNKRMKKVMEKVIAEDEAAFISNVQGIKEYEVENVLAELKFGRPSAFQAKLDRCIEIMVLKNAENTE